ncbi:MAG: macro domain-containing protein [Deltaproteobacteria bacterium]|nr:macro domain-containing protein [Deltaproteobacteria bacterium]
MLHHVTGDILLSESEAIAHGVAPGDHFENGLALALRKQWPGMYKDFRHYCHVSHPKPGGLWAWGGPGGVRIVNLFTQDPPKGHHGTGHPGPAKVKHVNHSLKALAKLIKKEKWASVALPKLATGVGHLDWDDVEPLIEHHLGELDVEIYVYDVYHSGEKAIEE